MGRITHKFTLIAKVAAPKASTVQGYPQTRYGRFSCPSVLRNLIARFPHQNGDLTARGPAQHLVDLPAEASHWTRDIQCSLNGAKMFVSVGSVSNVDDADTTPAEKNRAEVLEFNPDGSDMRMYPYGIRNVVGLVINPQTGELLGSVNERDGLGDNVVPDYITHVQ